MNLLRMSLSSKLAAIATLYTIFYYTGLASGQRTASIISPTNPPSGRRLCKNEYDDLGVCVDALECESTRGLNIGVCSSGKGNGKIIGKSGNPKSGNVCCLHLPCNVPVISNEKQDIIMKFGLRTSRDLRNILGIDQVETISAVLPARNENCGLSERNKGGQSFKSPREHQSGRNEQLINGQATKNSEQYPWMLALWIKFNTMNVPTCGAGLISSRYVITAAHCVADRKLSYVLRGGSIINRIVPASGQSELKLGGMMHPGDENGWGTVLEIESITINPKYQPFTFENDIALIRLKEEIRPSRELFPICLPPPVPANGKLTDYSGEIVTVTGWGCEKEDCGLADVPVVLREAKIPIVPNDIGMCWFMNDTVQGSGSEYIPSKIFIIGGDESGSISTCNGDSGSPVVRRRPIHPNALPQDDVAGRWEVIGLVSWSKGCGRPLRPCVWTRVESFVEWILSEMHD